ncbi:hypothetical protein K2P97_07470 [bacterium]|nr:hypothetical protein [bacterium]
MDDSYENKKYKITKVLEAHPEATKHTVPNGQKHEPIDSPLIRSEISKHTKTWIEKRKGLQFPIDEKLSSLGSSVIFSSSMTTAADFNPAKYREISGVAKEDGSVLPIHVLPHNDENRHLEKLAQEKQSSKLDYEIEFDED